MPQIKGKDPFFIIFPSLFNQIMQYVSSGKRERGIFLLMSTSPDMVTSKKPGYAGRKR
jgi:hypothetical protein